MTVALILQHHFNLSDQQMEHPRRYDLEIKAALGLPGDEPGNPMSNFSDFRARLLEYGRECKAFNAFTQMLVEKGWIKRRKSLILDACHMESNAASHNSRVLIRKAT